MRLAFAAPLVALAGCATPADPATDRDDQAIIGGSSDSGDAATVMLAAYPSDQSTMFTCSGVLVSPTALVTAAHCLDHAGYSFGVYYAADASAYPTIAQLAPHLAATSAAVMHPSYDRTSPFTADIGVVTLAAATQVTPLAFSRVAPVAGTAARIVGYGETTYGTYAATRMSAETTIAAIDVGDTIFVGDSTHHTCVGDSGGPAIIQVAGVDTVVGVDSYSDTTGCTDPSHFRRTDTYASFIDQYAGTSPPLGGDAGVTTTPDALPTTGGSSGGGCNTGGGGSGGAWLVALVALAARARRRTR